MTVIHAEKLGSSSRAGVSWSDGMLRLRDDDLFGEGRGEQCVCFLRRVFTLSEVAWVEIDRTLSTAGIHYDTSSFGLAEFLQRLAAALRSPLSLHADAASKYLEQDLTRPTGRIKIQRFGTILTTWDIVHDRPGRIRLRHQTIYRDAVLANRLRSAIENFIGVIECAVWPVTGSVLIRFDPNLISAAYLLQLLDRVRNTPVSQEQVPPNPKPAGFGLASSSLALAVAGEIAAPVLLPASAILLVGSNLHTFSAAGRQLLRGQFGLPVLYTSIVAVTLASGQFIASAAMSWMLTFWSRRYYDSLASARRRLLGQIIHQPHFVRLAAPKTDSIEVEVSTEDLKPNDVIVVSAGEQIPADGRILQGRGLVDERMIKGLHGISRKQPDDKVFAGSTIQLGELHVEVLRHGSETQVARLARIMFEVTTAPHGWRTPTLHGEQFAEQTVAPTIAIAGLGLLIGDISTAGAILRPDYATGPGVAFPLETLQAIALSLRHGVLIREPQAIERLATADMLVLEHHPALEHTGLDLDSVEVFPGYFEDDLLRYAATAFHNLDDERAVALANACRTRVIALLDFQPAEFTTDLTLQHGNNLIKVGDLGRRAHTHLNPKSASEASSYYQAEPDVSDSLMVGINGQVAGLIHFRRSETLDGAAALRRLRSKQNLYIGIISEQSQATREALTASLGVDFHVGCLSVDDRLRFFRNCSNHGLKVAYVGDREIDPRVMAEVHVAISLVGNETGGLDHLSAPICVLQPQIAKLAELWEIARIHRRRLRVAHGYAMIPNLACIAGAFVWGFTSLASVVVTNLGTYCVYARTTASIRSLEHQITRSLRTRSAGMRKTTISTKA
jgi:cation transport ATPase